jgi:hypothetical protein
MAFPPSSQQFNVPGAFPAPASGGLEDFKYSRGQTKVIESDFRASAIFHSLVNALLFSFSVVCAIIFTKLSRKANINTGINTLAMSIISVIISIVSGGLMIYSLYRLILTKEYRDHIYQNLMKPSGFVGYQKKVSDVRDIPFQGEQEEFYPTKQRDIGSLFERGIRAGISSDDIDLASAGIV